MPTYDSTATYDSGLSYDTTNLPPRRTMAQIKLEFRNKSPDELLTLFSEILQAMTGNASFTAPNPTLAALTASRDALQTKINDVRAKENTWRAAVAARGVQEDATTLLFTQLSSYVQNVSGGDEAKILSSGFQVRSAPAPITMVAPANLRATTGDSEGEIDLAWDRVRGASSYIIECREQTETTLSPWQAVKAVTQSRFTVTGLTGGKIYAFRVRAIGTQGEGPWSDEAVKRAV